MYHNTGEGSNWAGIAESIKDMQKDVNYRSDSGTIQDIMNFLKNESIKIGKLEFDNTELPILRNSVLEIVQILRGKEEKYDDGLTPVEREVATSREMKGFGELLKDIKNYENVPNYYNDYNNFVVDYGEKFVEELSRIINEHPELSMDRNFRNELGTWLHTFNDITKQEGRGLSFPEFNELATAIREFVRQRWDFNVYQF
jgi:hypothetical protein